MKRISSKFILSSAFALSLASPAFAQNTFYAPGDLVLTFQKEGDANTVYANLGSAAVFRGTAAGAADGTNVLNIADVSSALTSAFGAGWASDTSIYAGLAGVYSTNSSNSTIVNGDPARTLYVSASRADIGTVGTANSAGYTVNTNTGMTTGASGIFGQNNAFEVNYDAAVTVSLTPPSLIKTQNPFLSTGVQDTAFGIFGGGVQQAGSASSFGTFGAAGSVEFALDLYRILAKTGITGQVAGDLRSGSYEGTVTVNSSGKVSFIAQGASTVVAPLFTAQPSSTMINSGATATLTVEASGTSPTFQWYTGNSGDTSNPIGGATSASYSTALTATTSFWVRASNSAGAADSVGATVTVITGPAITTQPVSVTINNGATTTLSVATSGTSPTFQWYTGNSPNTASPIANATTATYTTSALTATTSFWVRTHNTAGDADSSTAVVTVRSPYDSWMTAYPSINQSANADPDKDGLSNLNEFALGGNPSVASASIAPTAVISGSNWVVSFNRSADSVSTTTAVVQYSTNLSTWIDVSTPATSGAQAVNVPKSNAVSGKLFTRLKVAQP